MRAREVGDIVTPGEHLVEVTDIGTQTWELFIAYRRADSAGHTGRVGDHLIAAFGNGQVFKDIEALPPRQDFVDVVRAKLELAVVMVVIIGPQWLCARLSDPNDLHREEVRTALQRGIPVIPVLVNGAHIPRAEELPEDMRALSRRQAIEVSDSRWHFDMGRVSHAVMPSLMDSPRRRAFVRQVPPHRPGPYWQFIEDNPPLDRQDGQGKFRPVVAGDSGAPRVKGLIGEMNVGLRLQPINC